jgi:5'-nucleotidase
MEKQGFILMMHRIPAKPRVLLSNDDGVYAPGIGVLEKIARTISDDVWIVAPHSEQSGTSHSLTLRNPLRITSLGEKKFSVEGTPTDCVLLAINNIMKDCKPDLVLSGVNNGSNLGEDVTYSGTIAAAIEATLLGVPSVAFSQMGVPLKPTEWDIPLHYGPILLKAVLEMEWAHDVFLNVNFPNIPLDQVKGIETGRQGRHKISEELLELKDPRGLPYYWIGAMRHRFPASPGTDLAIIEQGKIAVTPLHLDLTHDPSINIIKNALQKIVQ